jgi:MFS family permease
VLDFGEGLKDSKGKWAINASLLGFISSSYQLGSILAVPVAPWFNNKYGRRWSVMLGSVVMVIGCVGWSHACWSRTKRVADLFFRAPHSMVRRPLYEHR